MDIEVLSKKTLTDLKAIAKIAGIKGVSTMRKEELLSLLISMNEEAVSPKPVNRAAEQPEPVQQKEKKKRGRKPKPKQETVNAEEPTKASVTEPEETSLIPETVEEEPEENEDELIAVITAAIACMMEEGTTFTVRHVKRVSTAPAWQKAGREEQIYSH